MYILKQDSRMGLGRWVVVHVGGKRDCGRQEPTLNMEVKHRGGQKLDDFGKVVVISVMPSLSTLRKSMLVYISKYIGHTHTTHMCRRVYRYMSNTEVGVCSSHPVTDQSAVSSTAFGFA